MNSEHSQAARMEEAEAAATSQQEEADIMVSERRRGMYKGTRAEEEYRRTGHRLRITMPAGYMGLICLCPGMVRLEFLLHHRASTKLFITGARGKAWSAFPEAYLQGIIRRVMVS